MVGQILSCPPGLEVAGLAAMMSGGNLAVDAMTAYAAAAAASAAAGSRQSAPDMQAPGPVLLGRGLRGGFQRGADDKAASQSQLQRIRQASQSAAAVYSAPEKQRVQADPASGKESMESAVANRRASFAGLGGRGLGQLEVVHEEGPSTPALVPSPLAPAAVSAAAPLSLANALGFGLAQDTSPVMVPTSKATAAQAETASSLGGKEEEEEEEDVDAFIFGFTIRVAGGTDIGLATSVPLDSVTGKQALYLRIDSVLVGGAVEAWNRQCGSSGAPEKVLLAGDKIIRVNSAEETEAMLKEFESGHLFRMLIVRTPSIAGEAPQQKRSSPQEAGSQKFLSACLKTPASQTPGSHMPQHTIGMPKPIVLQAAQFPQASIATKPAPVKLSLASLHQRCYEL